MNFISLFSGIDGFDSGFELAGMECIGKAEQDRWCNAVSRFHSPNIKRVLDVKEINRSTFPIPDLICAGVPCQDVSIAGKRAGLDGERTGLFFEFARIVKIFKPQWLVFENVPGLLSSNGRRDFARVLGELGECGYMLAYRVLDSQYFGVAQRRRRVFIVGSLGNGRCTEILFESESLCRNPVEGRKTGTDITQSLTGRLGGGGPDDNKAQGGFMIPEKSTSISAHHAKGTDSDMTQTHIVHPLKARADGSEDGTGRGTPIVPVAFQSKTSAQNSMNPSDKVPALSVGKCGGSAVAFTERTRKEGRNLEVPEELSYALTNPGAGGRSHCRAICNNVGVRRLTPRECERLQGFPDDYTRYGMEDGKKIEISDTQRYRMLGNAVTRTVSMWIGKRVQEC